MGFGRREENWVAIAKKGKRQVEKKIEQYLAE